MNADAQNFAPLEERREFWSSYKSGNDDFATRYGLSSTLPVITKQEPTYKGLTETKRQEIESEFYKELNSPKIQIELNLRRASRWISETGRLGRIIVNPIRSANNYLRLRFAGW